MISTFDLGNEVKYLFKSENGIVENGVVLVSLEFSYCFNHVETPCTEEKAREQLARTGFPVFEFCTILGIMDLESSNAGFPSFMHSPNDDTFPGL